MWAWFAFIALIDAEPSGLTAAVIQRRSARECREEVGIEVFILMLVTAVAMGVQRTSFAGVSVYVKGAIDTPTVG